MDGTEQGTSKPSKRYRPFLLVVLFISLYLTYLVLNPFLHILVLAIVLASLFYPFQELLVNRLRIRRTLAAFVIIFIITFVIAIPVFFFVSSMISQGVESVNQVNEWLRAGNLQKLTENQKILAYSAWLEERLTFVDLNRIDLQSYLLQGSRSLGQVVLSKGAVILGNVATLLSHFFIMIFIVFYLVRDGAKMIEQIRFFSPLRKDQEDRLLNGVRVVARSVLLGIFLTAMAQGLVGGIGLSLVGIPGLFWGTVMGFSSLIPLIGTALVWVPTVVYLLLLGKTSSAIFLALWSVILVGSIDNFLRPFLMGGKGGLSPFYVFLAIVGGVQYFGLIGILYGPLILSFAMIMLYIYGVEYREELAAGDMDVPDLLDSGEEKKNGS